MARYGQSFKDKAVARLLPPECAAVEIVAREACIGVGTLLRWREKEATRDAVRVAIKDFLYDDRTGLPDPAYDENDIDSKTNDVYRHVYRVYPTIPSPIFGA